jgi:hypothetical protein
MMGTDNLSVETFETIKRLYEKVYEYIIDFGDSLYKN